MFRIVSNNHRLSRALWGRPKVVVGAVLRVVGSAWHRCWQPVGIITGLIATALAVTVVFWDWPHTGLADRDERVDVVRTLGLIVGGVLALGVAVWRGKTAQSQADLGELDLSGRRYEHGISLLGSDEFVDRLAGIDMLGELARSDPSTFRE